MATDPEVTINAIASIPTKQTSILWEIRNSREAFEIAKLGGKNVGTCSFELDDDTNDKINCTLYGNSFKKLKMQFASSRNLGKTEPYASGSRVFYRLIASSLIGPTRFLNIFRKLFINDYNWEEEITGPIPAPSYWFPDINGSLKIQFDITKYVEEGNDVCRTQMKEDKTVVIFNSNQIGRKGLINDISSLLGDEKTSDFRIQVLEEEVAVKMFHCHKAILSARNEVFRKMFENKEMKEVKEGVVEINDISFRAMELYLKYLYTGVFIPEPFEEEEQLNLFSLLPELAYIADKYNDAHLKSFCDINLHRAATPENICKLMQAARTHDLSVAQVELRKLVMSNPGQFVDSLLK